MRAPEFWHAPPGLAAGLLAPLGAAWDVAGRLRRAVVRPYRAPIPVICVGNLVAGGAGKTPVVLSLAGMLTPEATVHIVTRGYGGSLAGPVLVDPARHDAAAVGDEALVLAAEAPCWVARDRAAGVRQAVLAGARAVLLDDGFQNPGIDKDVSLLVVDAAYGFGNSRVMPAGPLREPAAAGLARADAVVLIGDGDVPKAVQRAQCPVLRALLRPVRAKHFAGARVVAFAGIGRPEKFFASLAECGASMVAVQAFPDHHPFTDNEIAGLRRQARQADVRLVTTAKDWVRLSPQQRQGIGILQVEIVWQDGDAVSRLLSATLRRHEPRQRANRA